MTLSAVVTTGIYCRSGCPAQPLPRNVRSFPNAAAAEAAGFRACLRCRPYRSEFVVDWSAPAFVCRAVQLVLGGALDDATEADLAARLGVSARHLRRLFEAHVGATPDQLARSRRVHFARRLLDDTDLTITEIAYAAGFGSTRQLNRATREVFRATPSDLRARRRRGDLLTADGGLPLRVGVERRFDWDAVLERLAAQSIRGVEGVDGGTYRRTVRIGGDPGVLELRRGGDDHLVLVAHLPHWQGLIHVVDRVRAMVGPMLAPWDPFEAAARVAVANDDVIAAIVERHGTPVPGIGHLGLSHTFPSAASLRDAADVPAAVRGLTNVVLDGSRPLADLLAEIVDVAGIDRDIAERIAVELGDPEMVNVVA